MRPGLGAGEAENLARLMTAKFMAMEIPCGGDKGGIDCDPAPMDRRSLRRTACRHRRDGGSPEECKGGKGRCFNPGLLRCPVLEALRELTDIPVVGIAEAAIFLSCFLAPKFSVITVIPRVVAPVEQIVRKYGVSQRLASVRATKLSVLEFVQDLEGGNRALMRAGRLAVEEDGAEVLLLGCAGMARLDGEMEEEVGVPVIDGVVAAVKIAEGLVDLNKRTSKVRTYARPEKKPISGFPPIFCE